MSHRFKNQRVGLAPLLAVFNHFPLVVPVDDWLDKPVPANQIDDQHGVDQPERFHQRRAGVAADHIDVDHRHDEDKERQQAVRDLP